jgi:hypothetical protein
MAIKINGTTVIDDSRNLVNIASGAGSSTTYGAVGTYVIAFILYNGTTLSSGDTFSASSLQYYENTGNNTALGIKETIGSGDNVSTGLSGTWRMMNGDIYWYSNGDRYGALFVRIS